MFANLITLSRLILLYMILYMISCNILAWHMYAVLFTIVLIVLDGVDGIVARHCHTESEFGSVFDIVIDRIVENCFWIFFAVRGVVPAAIPIIVLSRGLFTDGIRSVALAHGMTAFGERSMQSTQLGKLLVTSHFSRGLYGTLKVFSFLFLIIMDAQKLPEARDTMLLQFHGLIRLAGEGTIYLTVALCIIRGLPVIMESRRLILGNENDD